MHQCWRSQDTALIMHNAALGSPTASSTAGTEIITVPNIIVEIARVQNAGKLEKEYCDKNAMQ